jgi:hypothetical protein
MKTLVELSDDSKYGSSDESQPMLTPETFEQDTVFIPLEQTGGSCSASSEAGTTRLMAEKVRNRVAVCSKID